MKIASWNCPLDDRKKERKKEKDVYLLFDIAVKNESEAITFARERERESGN